MSLRFAPMTTLAAAALAAMPASSARADAVRLASGDTINATVVDDRGATVTLEHASLGTIEVARDQIVTVNGEPMPAPPPPPPPSWKSRFDLGGTGSFGNSDTQSLRVGVTSKKKTETGRSFFDASYYYGATDGDRDSNELTAGLRHDYLIPDSQWFYFAQTRYDYDEFQSWDHRIGVHGGVGYQLVERENYNLGLRGGLGFAKEFGSKDEDFMWEALLGLDLEWLISDAQSFQLSSTLYPDLSDTGEYRLVTTAGWQLKLDADKNMNLTAGLLHEYESLVDPGIEKSDLKVFAGLGFDF